MATQDEPQQCAPNALKGQAVKTTMSTLSPRTVPASPRSWTSSGEVGAVTNSARAAPRCDVGWRAPRDPGRRVDGWTGARVSSRPRTGAARTGRLAIIERASITERALAASRCARWMVIVSDSTSRWIMYFTLATLTTASTFEPFRQTPRGRTLGRISGSLPSASSLGSFGITSAAGCPFCHETASLLPPSHGATSSTC